MSSDGYWVSGSSVMMKWIYDENPSDRAVSDLVEWLLHNLPFGSPDAMVVRTDLPTRTLAMVDEAICDGRRICLRWVASLSGERVRFQEATFVPPDVAVSS